MSASLRVRKTGQVRVLGLNRAKSSGAQGKPAGFLLELFSAMEEKGKLCLT